MYYFATTTLFFNSVLNILLNNEKKIKENPTGIFFATFKKLKKNLILHNSSQFLNNNFIKLGGIFLKAKKRPLNKLTYTYFFQILSQVNLNGIIEKK